MKLLLGIGSAISLMVGLSAFVLAGPQTGSTVHITNNVDSGHGTPAYWAYEDFDRTTTITDNGDGTYTVLLEDSGTFKTIAGAGDPAGKGVSLPGGVQGTFVGTYTLTVKSTVAPKSDGVPSAFDYQCDPSANCPGRPETTSDWPLLYFGNDSGAEITGGGYNWTYQTKNCDGTVNEQWVDSSDPANNDGQSDTAGDITGKASDVTCPSPTPSSNPSPSPSASPAPTVPGLPDTGHIA